MAITLTEFFEHEPTAVLTFLDDNEHKVSLVDGEITLSSNSNSLGSIFIDIEDKKGFFRPSAIGKWTRFSDESIAWLTFTESQLKVKTEIVRLVKAATAIRNHQNDGKRYFNPVTFYRLIDPSLATPKSGLIAISGNGTDAFTVVTDVNGISYVDRFKIDWWRYQVMSDTELEPHQSVELKALLTV